jgi:cysteine-rich repeat protein
MLTQLQASLVLAIGLAATTATAQVEVGHLFIAAGDVVYDITDGGDMSTAAPFASGLSGAQDVCVGPGAQLYVTEQASGEITVISAGGDFSSAAPFASGLIEPFGLWCDGARVLVSERAGDRVVDATAGGDLSSATALVSVVAPEALFEDRAGTLWVVGSPSQVFDADGAFANVTGTIGGIAEYDDQLLASVTEANLVVDYTAGGSVALSGLNVTSPGAMLSLQGSMLLVSSSGGTVTDADEGMTFATGLGGIEHGGMAYAHRCGDGIVGSTEQCDDGIGTLTCRSDCTPVVCGDGILDMQSEECDDGNTDDGDGCTPTCSQQYRLPFDEKEDDDACQCGLPGAPSKRGASWLLLAALVLTRARRGSRRRCR